MPHQPAIRSRYFGRQARPLGKMGRELVQTFLPLLQIDVTGDELEAPKPGPKGLVLEIGFGGGEHLVEQARRAPEMNFIGCEPFMNGVSSVLSQLKIGGHTNVRLVVDDARLVLKKLPDNCLDRVYILFPDPWPKKRHNKRRIVCTETLMDLRRVMKPQGELVIATDHPDYQQWILEHLQQHPIFKEDLKGRLSHEERPIDWVRTRYERKALAEGRASLYLFYHLQKRL